ncbi:protein of unknown function [Alteromonadaceae bacterium Bs31]|nr:protein of unknown function [Alteromonadaceae bacterium Bs31]
MKLSAAFLLICLSSLAFAGKNDMDQEEMANQILANSKGGPEISPLNWLNENFLERQRKSVNNLTATHFGRRLLGDKRDIPLLQRIIDEGVIPTNKTMDLQALGVVLGDIFVKENNNLSWVIYKDDLGPTQAVCVADTTNCLFPITMLSRRMEVGLKPSVERVYAANLDELKPFFPKTPYSTK